MKNKKFVGIAVLIILVLGLGYLYQTVPGSDEIRTITMKDRDGNEMGTITMSETRAGVLLSIDLEGLTPNGEHAFHIHETGKCSGTFKSAGGHYNPMEKSHGMKHPEGHHAGDMPNLKPNKKGEISTKILNRQITLAEESTEKRATVFDKNGSSIIIHAGADDHMSQPSGAAGDRIACGIIE